VLDGESNIAEDFRKTAADLDEPAYPRRAVAFDEADLERLGHADRSIVARSGSDARSHQVVLSEPHCRRATVELVAQVEKWRAAQRASDHGVTIRQTPPVKLDE
jgi:hypothetical protein